jgi:hypothetical protein
LKRGTIAVGVQSLEDTAYENDASKSTSSQFSWSSSLNNEKSSSATAIDQPSKKTKTKKTKRRQSEHQQKYVNVGVQSLYHGVFITF